MDYNLVIFLITIGILVAYILFLITQGNLLRTIQPLNRRMSPGEVWLQLIPVFNIIWVFVVVIRISDSIKQEFRDHQENAFLGLADTNIIEEANSRPTYNVGIVYATLVALSAIASIIRPLGGNVFGLLLSLGVLVCWVIYWVKLYEYKKKINQLGLDPSSNI